MIHYHGLPITPAVCAVRAIAGGHAFVSFRHSEQLSLATQLCQSFAVDNGAFSAWRSGEPVEDWEPYYNWVKTVYRHPAFDFAVIPDVIDGGEKENDALVEEWPWTKTTPWVGAPVWHMHESPGRLRRLAEQFPRVCIGSSGRFSQIGTGEWWGRMGDAFRVLCDANGQPMCKLHGLRMLDPRIFGKLPLSSADSTNIARNIGIDAKWNGAYSPASKETRALIMRDRIESHQSAPSWRYAESISVQNDLFSEVT